MAVLQELELRGKALRWIRNFRSNILKEIASFKQEEGAQGRRIKQDRELKELVMAEEERWTDRGQCKN